MFREFNVFRLKTRPYLTKWNRSVTTRFSCNRVTLTLQTLNVFFSLDRIFCHEETKCRLRSAIYEGIWWNCNPTSNDSHFSNAFQLNTEMNCLKVELQKSEALHRQYREKLTAADGESCSLRKATGVLDRRGFNFQQAGFCFFPDELREARRDKQEMADQIDKMMEDNRTLKEALDNTSSELQNKLNFITDMERHRSINYPTHS